MQSLTPFIALLSGVIVAVITYLFTVNKEHVFLIRQKYEALFIAVSKYDLSVDRRADIISRMIMDQMDFEEADKDRDKYPLDNNAFEEANMLVNIYFHDLIQNWNEIEKIRDEMIVFNNRIYKMKQFGEEIKNMRAEVKKQQDIYDRFTINVEVFKQKILGTAREKSAVDALKPSFFIKIRKKAQANRSRSLDG